MNRPPGIWVGDLLRALAELPDVDRSQVLDALGMALPVAVTGRLRSGDPPGPDGDVPRIEDDDPGSATTPLLELLEPVERAPSAAGRPVLPGPATVQAGLVAPVEHQPILSPSLERRLLRAALGRPGPGGVVDVRRAVRQTARLRPLSPVPYRSRWRIVAGAQLLVDLGSGLDPVRADQADVVRGVRRLLGSAGVEVRRFRQVPTRPAGCGAGPLWSWRPYHLPARGTPVLVLTDLGLATSLPDAVPAAAFEWAELFGAWERRGIVPVVLAPYRAVRVPTGLRRKAVVVSWSAGIQPRSVRQAVASRTGRKL